MFKASSFAEVSHKTGKKNFESDRAGLFGECPANAERKLDRQWSNPIFDLVIGLLNLHSRVIRNRYYFFCIF